LASEGKARGAQSANCSPGKQTTNNVAARLAGRKDSTMTRKTIDYTRLGVEACEAFTAGPEEFADFVRTTLFVAAPLHDLETATTGTLPELLSFLTPPSETRH
jgi:hypothetical protein